MNNTQVVWFEENFKEYDADLRRRKALMRIRRIG